MGIPFKPPSKSLTSRDVQFIALAIFVFFVISIALVFANLTLTGGGGEFYVHWVGSRAFAFDKIEPYSGEVASRTQKLVYGGSAKDGQEPYILVTPFHILLLYFPFSLLSDPVLARAIFTWILELALFALVFLSLRLTVWESPRLFFILFIIFGVFNFYSYQAIYEASPVLILGFIYAGMLASIRAETDELTGALIAVSLYYWEVGAPFLFLVALRMYYEKRSRVLAGFFMLTFVLLAISFLLYPDWIIPFFRAAANNLRADFGFSIFTTLRHIWPNFGESFAWVFIAILVILLGYEWSIARGSDFRRFYWVACLTLVATPLLGFRTQMENLTVLIVPLALIFAIVHDRWHRIGDGLTILLMLFVFITPWTLNFFAVERFGRSAQEILFLFLPIFTLLGLYWIRWWALRPPRTWIDFANRS